MGKKNLIINLDNKLVKQNKGYTININLTRSNRGIVKILADLFKFKLTSLVVMTSIFGYLLTAGVNFDKILLGILTIGGFLVAAGANCLNQVLEQDFDKQMTRTQLRPLVIKELKTSEGVFIAGICCLMGVSMLSYLSPISGLLGMISFILYAFVYTPLKRYSTVSVPVGAIPGALPILIGCTAVDGQITLLGILLFAIQFLWQFPHFWSIGFLSFDDYKKAGFKLLPEIDGRIDRNIGLHSTLYAALLCAVIVCLFSVSSISTYAVVCALFFSLIYLLFSINFHLQNDTKSAKYLMLSSFFYLPLTLSVLLF